MKKTNKIDATTFENIVMEQAANEVTVDWNGVQITVTKVLSLKQVLTFVNNIVKLCFDDEMNYMPEVKDFAIKSNILELYGNFELPKNAEKRYDLIYRSDAVEVIMEYIDSDQLREIVRSADEKMKHMAQANVEMVNVRMNELYDMFETLGKQIATVFDGVNPEDMSKLVNAMSGMDIGKLGILNAMADEASDKVVAMQPKGK